MRERRKLSLTPGQIDLFTLIHIYTSLVLCGTIKSHSCLSGFVQDRVMRKVPQQFVFYVDFVKWHSSCMTLGKILFYGGLVIFKELAI